MINAEPQLALLQLAENGQHETENATSSRIRVLNARAWAALSLDTTPLHDVTTLNATRPSKVTKEQLSTIYQGHYGNFNAILAAEKALF
jgi:hypothetical protein